MVVFSYDLGMVESDLTVMDAKKDEIIGCLVKGLPKSWKPSQDWKVGIIEGDAPTQTVSGANWEELYDSVQGLYIKKWWGDGLPVGAATQARIDWLMTGVEHEPDEVVGEDEGVSGKIVSSNRLCTFEKLAIQMAMAGGRPEYMCVAEAMVKGISDARITLASSMSSSPYYVVNGPIADDIRLCNGFHLWGPNPKNPAGLILARCLWFVYQNVGNMLVGKGTIGQYGDDRPGRCFAESEGGLPAGWTTYAEDYYDRTRGTNCVTTGTSGMGNMMQYVPRGGGGDTIIDEIDDGWDRLLTAALQVPNSVRGAPPWPSSGSTGMLVCNGTVARFWANAGWTKQQIQEEIAGRWWYCYEMIKYKRQVRASLQGQGINPDSLDPLAHYALYTDPTRIQIVVAGGDHTSQNRWLTSWSPSRCFDIVKPSNWNQLLADALEDLGPMPPKGEGGVDL